MATDALRAQVAAKWKESFERLNHGHQGILGLMAFSEAWNLATEVLRPHHLDEPSRSHASGDDVRAAFELINTCRRLPVLLEAFVDDLHKHQSWITEEVKVHMANYETTPEPGIIKKLVFRLADWYKAWTPMAELGYIVTSTYVLTFQTHIYSILPPSFAKGFKSVVADSLETPSSGSTPHPDSSLWGAFAILGLIDRYENLIASVVYEYIEAHVIETYAEKWDESVLGELREWMTNRIIPWMILPYARGAANVEDARVMMQPVGSRFDFHMYKTLCDLRTKEIFDIIIDHPDSVGALQDLKECLQRVDQRAQLVESLRTANDKRLLHPGADTRDILLQYVSTIKCLRHVDPPGVLLFKVADPIRQYLRGRPDTIRCIVASLVGDEESGDSLVDDDEPVQPIQQPEVEDYTDAEWNPEPNDAGPEFRANKTSDIFSTLVSIYDSKVLFIKELQVLLAQRLLAVKDGNYEKERRNIEILKIRFGEVALQVCEVMLKDMTDSRRIDQHVQSQQTSCIHPTIISQHFWPALEPSTFSMPGQLQELQNNYAEEFSTFKPDKRLRWLPNLGRVYLEIELEDRKMEAEVSPLEAAFIELFSEKDIWSVAELISRVGPVKENLAIRALTTWVDLGVLKEDPENVYNLLEIAEESAGKAPATRSVPTVEEPPTVMSVEQQQAEQMKVYWKFIEGMLTNLGSLSLDRIQTMLKFAPGYNRTIEQLASYMESAKREGLVTVKDGMWKLGI